MSAMNTRHTIIALTSVLFAIHSSSGDTLILKNGAELHGTVSVKRNAKKSISNYVIKLDSGIHIKLAASRVRHHRKQDDSEKSYEGLLASMPDTAASHWQMAEFCTKSRLTVEKAFHVQRTLELDPNHAAARKSQGFQRRDGKWTRQEEIMERRGYVKYGGRWMLPQQVTDLEQAKALEKTIGESRRKVDRIRKQLLNGRKRDQAIEAFATLNDPYAKPRLIEILRDEESPENREIYLKALARYDGVDITQELVYTALHDRDEGVLALAVELILQRPTKAYTATLLTSYLNSTSNWKINQAASILGKLGEQDSVLPLIGSLVTSHTTTIKPPGGDITTSFGSGPNGGGIGLNAGNRTKTITEEKKNTHVLAALARITGQNFGYSEYDWREWYKKRQAPATAGLRRDF